MDIKGTEPTVRRRIARARQGANKINDCKYVIVWLLFVIREMDLLCGAEKKCLKAGKED